MNKDRHIYRWLANTAWLLLLLFNSSYAGDHTSQSEYSTPLGITLVEVVHSISHKLGLDWIRLGDAEGFTVFVREVEANGQSECDAACQKDFLPIIALPDSKAGGDWTLVEHKSGQQWAYKGRPLYRFAKETRAGEVADNIVKIEASKADVINQEKVELEDNLLVPPKGWQVARFDPAAGLQMPPGIAVGEVPAAYSHALVDSDKKTLYLFDGSVEQADKACGERCGEYWRPLLAPELANSVGKFSLLARADGSRQWAFNGAPLFTYRGDLVPGDINGIYRDTNGDGDGADGNGGDGDSRWQVAVVARHFLPAGAQVRKELMFGYILSTAQGMPLYSRYSVDRVWTARTTDDIAYARGKRLGTKGCNAECLKTWRPFTATAEDQPSGFWEIVEREDGTRQWAYKGFIQFTNINDQPFDLVTADNQYVYILGDKGPYSISDTAKQADLYDPVLRDLSYFATAGFHWRVSDLAPK